MPCRHATIVLALALVACSGNKKEVQHARHSLYDADFAVVYSAAVEATRELYSNLDDFPATGMIKTAWHQVSYANTQDDLSNPQTVQPTGQGSLGSSPAAQAGGMPTRLAYKRYFIRFEISVTGGRPWRVKVVGHAAEWDPGNAMPTELHGLAKPPWLEGRTEALQVAIYRRVKAYAVPMKEEVEVTKEDAVPRTDPSAFKGVPPDAGKVLAALTDGIAHRDTQALRALLADDVIWSLGGTPGADTAMAMWQADPETLDAMERVIGGGCVAVDKRVSCPAGQPIAGTYQLVLEERAGHWKVTSFVQAE